MEEVELISMHSTSWIGYEISLDNKEVDISESVLTQF